MSELSALRNLPDVVREYDKKVARIKAVIAEFEAAGDFLRLESCVGGTFGNVTLSTGSVSEHDIARSLLRSAWLHVYNGLQIDRLASAADKKKFQRSIEDPAPFTMENIRATFGDFIANPRRNILRGLAEVFCDLDPAYKSHDRVKIGVDGLPKRIILTNISSYSGWGRDRLENVLNALATLQEIPFVTYRELVEIMEREDALLEDGIAKDRYGAEHRMIGRGVRLRRFKNGNGHLFFEPATLRLINLALAEFYGDVIADCSDDDEPVRQTGTAVSKDLQYYPTPAAVVERVIRDLHPLKGQKVLEPSCGCGRFMDALRSEGARPFGVEYDSGRAEECRAKGHSVLRENFLEMAPEPVFDRVVMNPPFYGKHYAKHVQHALKFLKSGGILTAILPITARYDHGLLDGNWQDLPVGSFSESGTNINTTVLTIRKS